MSQFPVTTDKELGLLDHVLKAATKGHPESVLSAADAYAWGGHWMMAIGDEKGKILDAAVASVSPLRLALELGSYCGYSAVRIARLLPPGARLVAVDPSELPERVGAKILEHAGLRERVEFVHGTGAEALPQLAARGLVFDFVLIDHDKKHYLADLGRLEELGLLRRGAVVVADNVGVFKMEDYQRHVRESGRYASTAYHEAKVEYDRERADGVQVSIYAG